jgi:hypothetical protein
MQAVFPNELEARKEIITELREGHLIGRARRWLEKGKPKTIPPREKIGDLDLIPADFWEFGHAFEGKRQGGDIFPGLVADWKRARFLTVFEVDGDHPGWSDRWGARRIGHGWKTWIWTREAIGVEIEIQTLESVLSPYSMFSSQEIPAGESTAKSVDRDMRRAGYDSIDQPFVFQAIAMLESREARTINHAAVLLAPLVPREASSSESSTKDRLRRKISAHLKAYPLGSS